MFLAPIIINCLISLSLAAGIIAGIFGISAAVKNRKRVGQFICNAGVALWVVGIMLPAAAALFVATRVNDAVNAMLWALCPEVMGFVQRTQVEARYAATAARQEARHNIEATRSSHNDRLAENEAAHTKVWGGPDDADSDVGGERESELAYGGDW